MKINTDDHTAIITNLKSVLRNVTVAGIGFAAAMVGAISAGQAADLTSHRAFYKVELGAANSASGVTGLKGGEIYSFTNSCDGWLVEVNTLIVYQYSEGAEVKSGWNFSAWEAKDGLSYRFSARRTRDGKTVEDIRGRATLKSVGGSGVATFSAPEKRQIKLPAGSVFPTRHMIDLLEKAEAGKGGGIGVLFDGASLENPFEVNTVIRASGGRADLKFDGADGLPASQNWSAQLAYFPIKDGDAEPEVELSIDLRGDGVASYYEQDFGNYTVVGTLKKVELQAKLGC